MLRERFDTLLLDPKRPSESVAPFRSIAVPTYNSTRLWLPLGSEMTMFPVIVRVCLVLVLALLSFGLWRKHINTSAFAVMLSGATVVAVLVILPFEKSSRLVVAGLEIDQSLERAEETLQRLSKAEETLKRTMRPVFFDALENGDSESLVSFLDAGFPADAVDAHGRPVISIASGYYLTDVVKKLLVLGADPNQTDAGGVTPLMATTGRVSRYSKYEEMPTAEDFMLKRAEIVNSLLGAKANPKRQDARGQTILHFAEAFDGETIRKLVAAGADVDAPNNNGRTPLSELSDNILDWMVDGNQIQTFIDLGADVNSTDSNGWSPLMHALRRIGTGGYLQYPEDQREFYTSIQNIAILLSNGAEVNTEGGRGWTPNSGLVRNWPAGTTPLMIALGHVEGPTELGVIKQLLGRKPDITVRNKDGKTALDYADEAPAYVEGYGDVKSELVSMLSSYERSLRESQ